MSDNKKLQVLRVRGKSMSQVLAEHPDTVVVNQDDLACKGILASMGMLDLFDRCEGPHWSLVASDDYHSHYVVAFRFANNPDPRDDGFLVYFVPKNGILPGLNDAVNFLVELKGGYDGKSPISFDSNARVRKN